MLHTINPLCVIVIISLLATVKWNPLDKATMLRLLQPVESSWKTLARDLLKQDLQYKIKTIEKDCFHNNASEEALNDVLSKWLQRNIRANRTWQKLCDVARKYECDEDGSLEQYMQENHLESEFMIRIMYAVIVDITKLNVVLVRKICCRQWGPNNEASTEMV